jgi:predicted PurR-regulated permease PerM
MESVSDQPASAPANSLGAAASSRPSLGEGGGPEQLTIAPLVMKWSVFVAAAGTIVYLCLLIVRPFLGVVGWSTILAIACYPFYERLVQRNGRVVRSAFMTTALMVLAVLVPLVFIGGVAVNQLLVLRDSLRQAFLDPESITRRITEALAPLTRRLGLDPDAIVKWASAHASEWVAGAGQHTMSAAAGAGGAMLSFAFIAIGMFLLLRHGEALVAAIPDLLPFERKRSEALLLRIRDVVHASMHGVVTIATVQGVLCGGMFWLLGIPAAALWGLVTVFASVVPFVGTAAVWVPGTVYLLTIGAWPKAIVLAIWGAAVVSSVDNFLRPRLVAGRVQLSGLAMFVAMLGGLQAFGALGIILGPVLFATAAGIVDVLRKMQPSHAPPAGASEQQLADGMLTEAWSTDSPYVPRGDRATVADGMRAR